MVGTMARALPANIDDLKDELKSTYRKLARATLFSWQSS